jgi:hypothetical protein
VSTAARLVLGAVLLVAGIVTLAMESRRVRESAAAG